MKSFAIVVAASLTAQAGFAAQHSSWAAYQKKNRYKCPGPLDTLKTPGAFTFGGKQYKHTGYRMEVQSRDDDQQVKLGVISAVKDVTPGTKANLEKALQWYRDEKVEWLVVSGDLALEEFDLEEVFDLLGEAGLPTIMIIGNSESRGSWARAYKLRIGSYPNLINGVWVRQIVADDVEFWTMPGYHDKAFVRQGAGCHYGKEDIDLLIDKVKPEGSAPVVLVSHGPPRGKGSAALDYVTDKENVGDPLLNRLLERAKIPFGLFGHILEAGGRGVSKDHATAVPTGKSVPDLYINPGSLSGDPWAMLDGKTSWGMAALFTIDGKNARYQIKRFPRTE